MERLHADEDIGGDTDNEEGSGSFTMSVGLDAVMAVAMPAACPRSTSAGSTDSAASSCLLDDKERVFRLDAAAVGRVSE